MWDGNSKVIQLQQLGAMNKSQHSQCGEPGWSGRKVTLGALHSTSCAEVGQDEEVQGKRATSNSTKRWASVPAVRWGEDPWQQCLVELCGVTACRAHGRSALGVGQETVTLLTLPPQHQFPFLEGRQTFS